MELQLPPEIESDALIVLGILDREAIDVYRFISDRFIKNNPASDTVFQFVFKSFYGLDNAGITPNFKKRYFELMSKAKADGVVDLVAIVTELAKFPNRKGQNSLQFSFATKLAATVNPQLPMYDSWVASVFGFRAPYTYKLFEKRLAEYLDFYKALIVLYEEILSSGGLKSPIEFFREKFQVEIADVSDHKVLDFILWAVGKQAGEVQ